MNKRESIATPVIFRRRALGNHKKMGWYGDLIRHVIIPNYDQTPTLQEQRLIDGKWVVDPGLSTTALVNTIIKLMRQLETK
jgi:hypothetical protein